MQTSKTISQAYPEMRGTVSQIYYPAWADIKLDGEFCHLIKKKGHPTRLINKNGFVRFDCPITQRLDALLQAREAHFLGELHYGLGKRHDLYALLSNKQSDKLEFTPFDIVSLDGKDLKDRSLLDRLGILHKFITPLGRRVISKDDLNDFYNEVISAGFEGVVVKNLYEPLIIGPNAWGKVKVKDRNDLKVSKIDPVQERIEVDTIFVDKGNTIVKQCGVKVMHADKKLLKVGDTVTIEHQGILSGGGLRHPVFIKKV